MQFSWLIGLAVSVVLGCSGSEVQRCSDKLEGVWRDQANRSFHVMDGEKILIFPLFDSARPAGGVSKATAEVQKAPFYFALHRRPTVISGSRKQRLVRGSASCDTKTRAELVSCKGGTLTLEYSQPEIVGWQGETCQWQAHKPQRLELER